MWANRISSDRTGRRVLKFVLAAAAAIAIPGSIGVGSLSAASAAAAPSDLFVTSPPDPIQVTPGTMATSTLTVGNLGYSPLDVTIDTRSVTLLDNGRTRFGTSPDPRFAGRITITPDALTLAGRQESMVHVTVAMPTGLPPDDYFLGFLVSPVINSASVAVQNDVGGLVVLDVPGSRDRGLATQFVGPSSLSLSLSSSAVGMVRATSVGKSTVAFTTTVDTTGWPDPRPPYVEVDSLLLPPGLSRDIPIRVSTWLGLGWYTFHTSLVYDRTDEATAEVTSSRTVIIVNPLWLLVVPVVLSLWFWKRKRRRSPRKKGLHSAGRSKTPAGAQTRQPVSVG
jgi:hypothetical protein